MSESLIKAGEISVLSLSRLASCTAKRCEGLMDALEKAVDKKLSSSCEIESIQHTSGIRVRIEKITSKVKLRDEESSRNFREYRDEPTELKAFSYQQLKESAHQEVGLYVGLLHGTVVLHSCPTKEPCPSCDGSGICNECLGTKKVTCPVCEGSKECPICEGSGNAPCKKCGGDGECPDCDHGWVQCDECGGDGLMTCPDCDGSGNYVDVPCRDCDGTGLYHYDRTCRKCGGTGRFIIKCTRCDGSGEVDCDECDGEGGWDCSKCNGTGECSSCSGTGVVKCRACRATGVCGKCKGHGQIWCPDCQGKGICFLCAGEKEVTCSRCDGTGQYQSYTRYYFRPEEKQFSVKCSLSVPEEYIPSIKGDLCYDGIAYESFAESVGIDNRTAISSSVSMARLSNEVKKWLNDNLPSEPEKPTNDYLQVSIKMREFPITKVILSCNSEKYPIHIVGNNMIVFYETLPSWPSRIGARIKGLFGKKK